MNGGEAEISWEDAEQRRVKTLDFCCRSAFTCGAKAMPVSFVVLPAVFALLVLSVAITSAEFRLKGVLQV